MDVFSAFATLPLPDLAVWWREWIAPALSTWLVIGAAEMGDKSQLMCMTLAARYRPWPVLWGALAAFALLNLLAAVFGAVLAAWLPARWVALGAGGLFLIFGIQSLSATDENAEGDVKRSMRPRFGVFLTTLVMISAAELGDKTQLSVAGLAVTARWWSVWLGATLALAVTSGLGVWAGRRWLAHLPLHRVHQFSGLLFVGLGLFALSRAVPESWLALASQGWETAAAVAEDLLARAAQGVAESLR